MPRFTPATFAFCILLPLTLAGQTDSIRTILLAECGIYFRDQNYANWRSDSLPALSPVSVAERLLLENVVSVRANAPGGLATVSVRGLGPSRTPVIWQGLNLQSPMHGVVDLSLIPLWPGDRLSLHAGGQNALRDSGAIGGSILLERPPFSAESDILCLSAAPLRESEATGGSRLCDSDMEPFCVARGIFGSAGMGAGSFARQNAQAEVGFDGVRAGTLLRAAWEQAQNNFPFQNTALLGKPAVRQVNNFTEKLDIQQFNALRTKRFGTITSAVWYQRAFREIPPTMVEAPAQTWQRDRALRATIDWSQKAGYNKWVHRLAWLDEFIAFRWPGGTDSSRSRTALAASEYRFYIKRLLVKAGGTSRYQWAQADGYAEPGRWFGQARVAAEGGVQYNVRNTELAALVRQEWAEQQGTPFTWTLSSRWNVTNRFWLRGYVSRNFNLPTFNDRYWRNLGNPDLKPEKGYSANAGLAWENGWHFSGSYGVLQAEAAVFHVLLDDWILWQPAADGQFRPGNLRRVWSRGLEASASWTQGRWKFSTRHQWLRATNTAVYNSQTSALHKQLPYTPNYTASASLQWSGRRWSAAYFHQFTGRRFTDSDNSAALPGFHTGNLFARFDFQMFKQKIALDFRLENCWNSAYQIIAYRPMPGRAWRLGGQWMF